MFYLALCSVVSLPDLFSAFPRPLVEVKERTMTVSDGRRGCA